MEKVDEIILTRNRINLSTNDRLKAIKTLKDFTKFTLANCKEMVDNIWEGEATVIYLTSVDKHISPEALARFTTIMFDLGISVDVTYIPEFLCKPFNLEAAKAGKPVCTRDGRKARIICFDRVDAKPILALVASTDGKSEDVFDYFVSGKRIANALESNLDLMMLPEKKEGWVNVYKASFYKTEDKAKEHIAPGLNYLRTVKVEWEE